MIDSIAFRKRIKTRKKEIFSCTVVTNVTARVQPFGVTRLTADDFTLLAHELAFDTLYPTHAWAITSYFATMSALDSSPLPIPTFQASDAPCPKDLLDFLLNFIQLATHQPAEVLLHNSRKRWLSAFDTLNRSFLKPLELPEQFEWHMLHERTKLFEVTFELLYLLTTRCGEVLSYQEDLTKSMLSKLLDIASSLEVWLDVSDIPSQEDFPNPEKLYADCVKTINAMLRALAGCTKIDHEGRAGWQILRNIGEECLASCIGAWSLGRLSTVLTSF